MALAAEISNIRVADRDDRVRMVLDLSGPVTTSHQKSTDKLTIRIQPIENPGFSATTVRGLRGISGQWSDQTLTIEMEFKPQAYAKYFRLNDPERLVIDVYSSSNAVHAEPAAAPADSKTTEKAKDTTLFQLTREQAREALAARISELSDAVIVGELLPQAGRQKLVAYRNALAAAVAGRSYNETDLAEALGLPLISTSAPVAPQPTKATPVDPKPVVAESTEARNEQVTQTVKPFTIRPESSVAVAIDLPPVTPSALPSDVLPATVSGDNPELSIESEVESAPEVPVAFVEINTIRRPVLLDDMQIDFKDPFNPLELLFEAERQLLHADLEALKQ